MAGAFQGRGSPWARQSGGGAVYSIQHAVNRLRLVDRSAFERGDRLVDAVPYGPWKTTTFVAGLRASGIIAPFVLDGPMTGEAFRAYVEQVLAPELEQGDAVEMDILRPHKGAGVREAIQAAGASVLYHPSYSPDFNPIEHLFAKLKE